MLPIGRKNAPLGKTTDLSRFLNLPEDILILVFSQCCIDELLAFRLTHSKARNLIAEYMSTIAPSAARSTFPHSDLLLTSHDVGTKHTLDWLLGLIPRQLAAILVDRHRIAVEWTQSRYGIPAEDPFGDALRARVANGWYVLRQLSDISRDVCSIPSKDTVKSPMHLATRLLYPSRYRLDALQQREDLILARRIGFIKGVSEQHAKDYKLLFTLLSAAFSTSIANTGSTYEPWLFDWGGGIDSQRRFRKGKSWMAWFVLSQGPDLFWKQWWTLLHDSAQNHIRDRATEAFEKTPVVLANYQRAHAQKLQEFVNEKACVSRNFDSSNPYGYFARYADHRLKLERDGALPHKEIMDHVPFHVNFQCPEEVVKRFELRLEEGEAARLSQPLISRGM